MGLQEGRLDWVRLIERGRQGMVGEGKDMLVRCAMVSPAEFSLRPAVFTYIYDGFGGSVWFYNGRMNIWVAIGCITKLMREIVILVSCNRDNWKLKR